MLRKLLFQKFASCCQRILQPIKPFLHSKSIIYSTHLLVSTSHSKALSAEKFARSIKSLERLFLCFGSNFCLFKSLKTCTASSSMIEPVMKTSLPPISFCRKRVAREVFMKHSSDRKGGSIMRMSNDLFSDSGSFKGDL